MFAKYLLLFISCEKIFKSVYTAEAGDPNWWKHAVFYQIYPRSFKDSNNDGIGDIQGIISKLDYLRDLGISAVWLSPIYASPQVDQGYDISDFKSIHYEYGTMSDFEELVGNATEKGIKIIMDFVPNHSSDKHEWFKKSEKKESGYENYYVWRDANNGGPPNNWISAFKNSAWKYSKTREQYYLHQFAVGQPDLNYRDNNLQQEMKDILTFWLDKGVAGFRVDAVTCLYEKADFPDEPLSGDPEARPGENKYLKHIYTQNQPETYDMVYEWRDLLDSYTDKHGGDARIMMTEAYAEPTDTIKYYGENDRNGAHFSFNFYIVTDLDKNSNAQTIALTLRKFLNYLPVQYAANWVLGNHDNSRLATRVGKENVDGYNMLATLLPGIAVTYNGEEIGMENGEVTWEQGYDPGACNGDKEQFNATSRDFERTPFHWDSTVNAGFNEGKEPWLPVSSKYKENNLRAQSVVGVKSHYHFYKDLVGLRKEKIFSDGNLKILVLSDSVLAFTRRSSGLKTHIAVFNSGNKPEIVNLSQFKDLPKNLQVVLSSTSSVKGKGNILETRSVLLSAHEALVAVETEEAALPDEDWWKHGVFYQIYPRSFKDSNNDGVGDLQGIISKMEHFKDAGVTAVWLSPIYASPQVDQGYDISDYRNIHHEYGTIADFKELVAKAAELGIKVIMDFVPNHTSNKHEWFDLSQKSVQKYKDYYVWHDGNDTGGPPNNWRSIFKYSAWKKSDVRKQYYLHQFAEAQPDLNYNSPELVQEMKDVLKFWLDMGIAGFRIDAVPYLFETGFKDEPLSGDTTATSDDWKYLSHIYTSDQPETYNMISQWRDLVEQYTKEHGGYARIIMTEAYTDLNHTVLYYGNSTHNCAHFTFNFELITGLSKDANANQVEKVVNSWLNALPHQYISNWVVGNHDNNRVATRFGKENADGFNMLVSFLPGIAVTYNGEEIGMEDGEVSWTEGKDPSACNGKEEDFAKVSRDFERTPYQWDNSTNAGFNEGQKTWLPVSRKYLETNLKSQVGVKSHYTIYQNLLKFRKNAVLSSGNTSVKAVSENVITVLRALDEVSYILVFNLGKTEAEVDLQKEIQVKLINITLSSVNSVHEDGASLDATKLKLQPHESIIGVVTRADGTSSGCIRERVSIFIVFIVLSVYITLN